MVHDVHLHHVCRASSKMCCHKFCQITHFCCYAHLNESLWCILYCGSSRREIVVHVGHSQQLVLLRVSTPSTLANLYLFQSNNSLTAPVREP